MLNTGSTLASSKITSHRIWLVLLPLYKFIYRNAVILCKIFFSFFRTMQFHDYAACTVIDILSQFHSSRNTGNLKLILVKMITTSNITSPYMEVLGIKKQVGINLSVHIISYLNVTKSYALRFTHKWNSLHMSRVSRFDHCISN